MKGILKQAFSGLLLAFIAAAGYAADSQAEGVMLAKPYSAGLRLADYFVSEKLDGVRARWNGRQLISRGGKVFAAPGWFTEQWPPLVMDGELWSARGEYQKISSITAKKEPHGGWRSLRFMVFDMPAFTGTFAGRVAQMRILKKTAASAYLAIVDQQIFADESQLMQRMDEVLAAGGEGLMLHHKDAMYRRGRSNELLKLKAFQDSEAVVIGYREGKGKYSGMTGALNLRTADGIEFFVGSGLSDNDRLKPPAQGSVVTYKHQGYTDSGKPRFPVYLRIRAEIDERP